MRRLLVVDAAVYPFLSNQSRFNQHFHAAQSLGDESNNTRILSIGSARVAQGSIDICECTACVLVDGPVLLVGQELGCLITIGDQPAQDLRSYRDLTEGVFSLPIKTPLTGRFSNPFGHFSIRL